MSNEYYDIWEKGKVNERIDLIDKYNGGAISIWRTNVGLKTTSELLWLKQNDKKMSFFIWIAGLLWTAMKWGHWRGELYVFMSDLYTKLSIDVIPFCWHHATKEAIPLEYYSNWKFYDKLAPNTVEKIVDWAIKEWVSFNETHILVRLVEEK